MAGVGAYIMTRQADGADDRTILEEVLKQFPGARTTLNSVRWYRTQGSKRGGKTAAAHRAPESRPPIVNLPDSIPTTMEVDGKTVAQGDRGFYYVDERVRTFSGAKQRGFNATLYAGGAKVAEVIDEGNDGATIFHFLDEDADRVEVEAPNWKGELSKVMATPLEAHWLKHCGMLPKELVKEHPGETVHVSPEQHLGSLVDEVLVARQLKRSMQTHIVFLSGGKLMKTRKLEGSPDSTSIRSVEAKHPGARVLNGLPIAEAVKLVP